MLNGLDLLKTINQVLSQTLLGFSGKTQLRWVYNNSSSKENVYLTDPNLSHFLTRTDWAVRMGLRTWSSLLFTTPNDLFWGRTGPKPTLNHPYIFVEEKHCMVITPNLCISNSLFCKRIIQFIEQ